MKFKITKDKITPSSKRIASRMSKLPKEAYDVWLKATPKRTGNARRRTRLQGRIIKADYNYAVPLDRGHSRQSPDGMVKPTEKFIRKRSAQNMRK